MSEPEKSELTEAIRNKVVDVTIADKKLRLHKWTWRQSLNQGDKFIATIADVVKGKGASELLKKDVLKVVREHAETLAEILIDTVERGNFESRDEAAEWFDTLALDETVTLLGHVMKQNYIPLKDAFSELKRVVTGESSNTKPTATK